MDKIKLLGGAALAYVGDAVLEIYVRERIIAEGLTDTGKMSAEAQKLVCAEKQSELVDALIFAELSYVPFDEIAECATVDGITVFDAAEKFFKTHDPEKTDLGAIVPSKIVTMFYEMAKYDRFKNVVMSNYVNKTSEQRGEQFSALTLKISDGETYVAFRGTDDTVVGWEENFNMALYTPVPAQESAVGYLNAVNVGRGKKIYVGGQSKGGNLSVYASVKCNLGIEKYIVAVYNFDGPGFSREFLEAEDYVSIAPRIRNVFPEESIVGMLFEHTDDYTVVKSKNKGIWQHDSLTWQVEGAKFVCAKKLSKSSREFDGAFSEWLASLSDEERHVIIPALFDTMYATDSSTLTELKSRKGDAIKALMALEPEKKKLIHDKLGKYILGSAGPIIGDAIREKVKEIMEKIKK